MIKKWSAYNIVRYFNTEKGTGIFVFIPKVNSHKKDNLSIRPTPPPPPYKTNI